MEIASDLSPTTLMEALPGRAVRTYPALLSTEADAQAWARAGAPTGAVVVADYQASPRGRAGLEWKVRPATDLAFSVVLRAPLRPDREGWLYSVATTAVSDVIGAEATIEWPDQIRRDGSSVAVVGLHVELGPEHVEWAVLNVLLPDAGPPRGPLLARVLAAIEHRLESSPGDVLTDYLPRCETIGRSVRARLIPMGPGGPEVKGKAVGALMDGALLLETQKGNRVAVRPQNLGLLEDWSPGQDPGGTSAG